MNPRWEKLGRLYTPASPPRHAKLNSHAANPLPVHLKGDLFRVFFSGRDAQNRSSVGAVDVDIAAREVVQEFDQPVLVHGPQGSFYGDGVSIGNLYETDDGSFILFMGWLNPSDGHWRGEVGRIRVDEELRFLVDPATPFLDRNEEDPVSLSYPWVHRYGPNAWRMWYGSTINWDAGNREMLHVIKQAASVDGVSWRREGVAVKYAVNDAQAFSRPTVLIDRTGRHQMWYSYRGRPGVAYRIGYAESDDGVSWIRRDADAGIDVSASGWDSEMVAYPCVFSHGEETYMLYNGNGYGRSGFGLARLADTGAESQ